MGKQKCGLFLKEREKYFNCFKARLFEHKNFPLERINDLLKETGERPLENGKFGLQRFYLKRDVCKQNMKRQLLVCTRLALYDKKRDKR